MAKRKYYKGGIALVVYSTGIEFYVRLINGETPQFPHGIVVSQPFPEESAGEEIIDSIAKYLCLEEERALFIKEEIMLDKIRIAIATGHNEELDEFDMEVASKAVLELFEQERIF